MSRSMFYDKISENLSLSFIGLFNYKHSYPMIQIIKHITFFKVFIASVLIAIALVSCENEEFFELKSVPTSEWETISELEYGIAAVYQKYLNRRANCSWVLQEFIHFGMSDIVRQISINGGWSSNLLYERATDQYFVEVSKSYRLNYSTIMSANLLLDFLKTNPFPGASEEDRTLNINRIKGEAHFLRAMSYYLLVTYFAPAYDTEGANDSEVLTLRLTVSRDIETAIDNTPVKTEIIYNQIVKDLKEAKALLPLQYESGMHSAYQFGRANKHAAGAALARVYCLMGRYDEALDELNEILDNPSISRALEEDPENVWLNNDALTPWNSSEVIWYGYYADMETAEQRHVHEIRIWGFFINSLYHNRKIQHNWWIWGLNRKTLLRCNMIAEDNSTPAGWSNDKRNKLFNRFEGYNPNMNQKEADAAFRLDSLYGTSFAAFVDYEDPVFISSKYYRVPTLKTILNQGEASPQNIPLIRTAELHLWRAAIKQITGRGGQAGDINIVRERSWNTETGGAYEPLTDEQITWDVIDQEWIKEMAFESDRIIWLQMFKKPIGPGNRDASAIYPPYESMNWPVPLRETDFNEIEN